MLVISKYGRTGRKSSRLSKKPTFVPGTAQTMKSVILVVDDEALFLCSVTMMLQKQGYVVLSASDGAEALELSRRHKGSIDMVVTDVAMPRMNGIELAAHLVEERPGIKVLLISGTNMRHAVSPDLDQAFLPKPVDGQTLLARIKTLLAAPV
jgi:CheY-like chemotaxis protein